jgi:hypothetical protein
MLSALVKMIFPEPIENTISQIVQPTNTKAKALRGDGAEMVTSSASMPKFKIREVKLKLPGHRMLPLCPKHYGDGGTSESALLSHWLFTCLAG